MSWHVRRINIEILGVKVLMWNLGSWKIILSSGESPGNLFLKKGMDSDICIYLIKSASLDVTVYMIKKWRLIYIM